MTLEKERYMYGQAGATSASGGAALAVTGATIGSTVLAVIAIAMIVGGICLLFANHRRRHGQRP